MRQKEGYGTQKAGCDLLGAIVVGAYDPASHNIPQDKLDRLLNYSEI